MKSGKISIDPETSINDAIKRYPATRSIFYRHRLDVCCGGTHSIAVAALACGLDPDKFLEEVRRAAQTPPA